MIAPKQRRRHNLSSARWSSTTIAWNPQRIEQRIGRCHRYGQKHGRGGTELPYKKNAADQRVYELLAESSNSSAESSARATTFSYIESGVDLRSAIVASIRAAGTRADRL